MAFGTTVADSAASAEAWIKGFKDGVTRIRIAQELPTWIKYMQHFSKVAFYFPCEGTQACIGCRYPDELDDQGRPKMSVQYAFNALDEQGRLGIFRLGTKAFKILQSRHQRLETLVDRDYNIVRSGKGFDTTYIPEPGDKYEVDLPEKLIDIQNALSLKYDEAKAATLKALEEEAAEAAEALANENVPVSKAADEPKAAAPLKQVSDADKEAAKRAVEESMGAGSTPATDAAIEKADQAGANADFEDMGTSEIKEWLKRREVEIPSRVTRPALIALAEENRDKPGF